MHGRLLLHRTALCRQTTLTATADRLQNMWLWRRLFLFCKPVLTTKLFIELNYLNNTRMGFLTTFYTIELS